MGDETVDRPHWRAWDAQAWGRALFGYFFVALRGDTQPVSRLAISSEELAKGTGIIGAEPQAAREGFLNAIRCGPTEFRRHLSGASLGRGAWRSEDPPSFLPYLLFTCFAAASLDSDTVKEGVFRERLRILLGHPKGTSYALTELPRLWKAFERWLGKRREEGAPYRALVLPEPGRMRLIGYSMRLAFPPRSDRLQLVNLIRQAEWEAAPTVPEAIQLVSHRTDRFSSGFGEVFARARRAFARGANAPELEALWSAILEAVSLANADPKLRSERIRYQLFLQEDDFLRADPFLVASAKASAALGTVGFTLLDEPFGDYRFLVRAAADGSTTLIAKLLLLGALSDKLPDFKRTAVSNAVKQGVLLFRRNDNATWELAASRPEEGLVRALITNDLAQPFSNLFSGSKLRTRASKFDGWLDNGPFDVTSIGEVTEKNAPGLAHVRCLQRTKLGPQLTLAEGVKVDRGYMGTQGLFPVARCPGATAMTLFEVRKTTSGVTSSRVALLVKRPADPDGFEFAHEQVDLEGLFTLVATRDGQVIASRELAFHSRVLGYDYAVVTEPHRWITEAAACDVLSSFEGTECFLAPVPDAADQSPRLSYAGTSPGHARRNSDCDAEPLSVDDDPRLDRFVEAVAAISASRRGLGESELLELLERVLDIDQGPGIWDVVRAWVEAGYLDVLSRRHWRGRVYFARHPRLVITRLESHPTVVLHGIAPYRLRARARIVLRDIGAIPIDGLSVSRFVGAPLSWGVESIEVANVAANELVLPSLQFVRSPARLVVPLGDLSIATGEPVPGYEWQGTWDWEQGGFRRGRSADEASHVQIEWHVRADRPDLFIVQRRDGICWSTFARNWALLIGYLWAEKPVFEAWGQTTLIRPKSFGPYIPLPVARAIVLRAGVASGPIEQHGGEQYYGYRSAGTHERGWLLRWVSERRGETDALRRLAWILSALGDPFLPADTVAVPADLRRRLLELRHLPEAVLLSGKRIPRRMLPHLRRTIELAGV